MIKIRVYEDRGEIFESTVPRVGISQPDGDKINRAFKNDAERRLYVQGIKDFANIVGIDIEFS